MKTSFQSMVLATFSLLVLVCSASAGSIAIPAGNYVGVGSGSLLSAAPLAKLHFNFSHATIGLKLNSSDVEKSFVSFNLRWAGVTEASHIAAENLRENYVKALDYPIAKFQSNKMVQSDGSSGVVTGKLELAGAAAIQSFDIKLLGSGTDASGKGFLKIQVSGKVKTENFVSIPQDARQKIAEHIDITMEATLKQQ